MAENSTHKINLIVVTPHQNFYEGKVTVVTIPSADGEVGIMHGHSPLVFALTPGIVTVRVDNEIKHFVVSEGYAEVNNEMALVICNSAEWPEQLQIKWILDSMKKAKEDIAEERQKPAGYKHIKDNQYKLKRAQARLHLIELYGSEQQKSRLARLRSGEEA
ncbi:MAG: ATP synthase F1 subunit epsilon [Saccharofermentans sp.]|nr:ATP synthase F1 subunit epsilon [Saccharofermentans sp.]